MALVTAAEAERAKLGAEAKAQAEERAELAAQLQVRGRGT